MGACISDAVESDPSDLRSLRIGVQQRQPPRPRAIGDFSGHRKAKGKGDDVCYSNLTKHIDKIMGQVAHKCKRADRTCVLNLSFTELKTGGFAAESPCMCMQMKKRFRPLEVSCSEIYEQSQRVRSITDKALEIARPVERTQKRKASYQEADRLEELVERAEGELAALREDTALDSCSSEHSACVRLIEAYTNHLTVLKVKASRTCQRTRSAFDEDLRRDLRSVFGDELSSEVVDELIHSELAEKILDCGLTQMHSVDIEEMLRMKRHEAS